MRTANPQNLYDVVVSRLEAGESVENVAEDLGLKTDDSGTVVVLDGWYADDGNAVVYYDWADSGQEAAQEYVDDGSWGDVDETTYVTVLAWQEGVMVDEDYVITDVRINEGTYTIPLNPDEPDCVDGGDHRWSSAYELVGGIESNPGVWGHGGGVYSTAVCTKCGLKRTYDSWAQNRETGEQGLDSVSYEKTDIVHQYLDDLSVEYLLNIAEEYDHGVGNAEGEGGEWAVYIAEEPVTKLWAVISITELVGGSSDENLEGWYLTENEANDEAEGLVNNLSR